MGIKLLCLVLTIFAVHSKVVIQNLDDNFQPKNELDYVNYLKLILGRQDTSTTISSSLTQLSTVKQAQPLIDRVVIAFIPFPDKADKHHSNGQEIEFKGKLLQELVFETPQLFIITSLPANQEDRLHQLIEAYRSQGKVVHVIRGQASEVRKLGKMLDMEQPEYKDMIHHPTQGAILSVQSNRPSS